MLAAMESERFEIAGTRIRAAYGHSFVVNKPSPIRQPPDVLFDGTHADNYERIIAIGLLPMDRRFVHLSSDLNWVLGFVTCKERPLVLRLMALVAHQEELAFCQTNLIPEL